LNDNDEIVYQIPDLHLLKFPKSYSDDKDFVTPNLSTFQNLKKFELNLLNLKNNSIKLSYKAGIFLNNLKRKKSYCSN
jgi:hypothetical protein